MTKDREALVLQAAGVAGPGELWWEAFFPDDLPTDWQLEYYVHHHSRLLLPADVWAGTGDGPFGPWGEAVPAKLRLTLEWSPELPPDAGIAALAHLDKELKGSAPAVVLGRMSADQATAVETVIKSCDMDAAVVGGPAEPRTVARAQEALWYPDRNENGRGFWQVTPAADLDPMGWRELVESLAAAGGQGATPIFLRTRPDRLSDFRTVAQLLGVG